LKNSVLIAVGGNSLIRAGQKGTIPEQFANARLVCERIADLAARGCQIVVTHGNGPQVGSQLLRSEAGSAQTYTVPLDVCVAMTQGEIGYILQTTLQSIFRERRMPVPVVALITQVLVNAGDAAFTRSTKPVGPFYSEQAARQKHEELGWEIVEDAARGYRRVVPSPRPCRILELDVIHECLSRSMIVIAAGGGGIPVVQTNGTIQGVEAVIDKDRASALLASQLGLERMVISTDVEKVQLNFKTPQQRPLDSIGVDQARAFLAEGQFQEGSMRPKIEAAIEFLEGGGNEVIITNPEHLTEALEGLAGTHIRQGMSP
jgi:carbamate kinase